MQKMATNDFRITPASPSVIGLQLEDTYKEVVGHLATLTYHDKLS